MCPMYRSVVPEPPLAVAVTVVFDPEQTEGLLTLTLGKLFTVTVPVAELDTHPLLSVTVAPYVPATPELKLALLPGSLAPPGSVPHV